MPYYIINKNRPQYIWKKNLLNNVTSTYKVKYVNTNKFLIICKKHLQLTERKAI